MTAKNDGYSVGHCYNGWGMVTCTRWKYQIDQIDRLDLTCRSEMLCRICTNSTDPTHRNHVLDYAGYRAPTTQHELDHTDHTDQESICPERSTYTENVRIDDPSDAWQL